MIKLEDIIEASTKMIPKEKGFLVLHKGVKINPSFKVYKTYCYSLYFIGTNGDEKCVLRLNNTKNSPSDVMEKDWEEQDKEFLSKFLEWLSSPYFTELREWSSINIKHK